MGVRVGQRRSFRWLPLTSCGLCLIIGEKKVELMEGTTDRSLKVACRTHSALWRPRLPGVYRLVVFHGVGP